MISEPISDKKQNTVYFRNLDVLRFVAVFLVMLTHGFSGFMLWIGKPKLITVPGNDREYNEAGKVLYKFFGNTSFGVDIFFIISGFLITYLLIVEKDRFGKIGLGKFYVRRALRIWPLYFLILLITPFLINLTGSKPPNYYAAAFFYYNYHVIWTVGGEFPIGHFWSLSVEEHFYLVLPLIMFFFNSKHYLKIFITIIVISAFYRYYVFLQGNTVFYKLYYDTLSNMDTLALGGVLACWHFKHPIRMPKNPAIPAICILFLLFIFCIGERTEWSSAFMVMFSKYIYLAFASVLFLYCLFSDPGTSEKTKPGIFHYLGKISYGIYIYHNIVVYLLGRFIIAYNPGESWNPEFLVPVKNSFGWFCFLYFGLTIAIAALTYELLEKRILKLKNRFSLINTKR